MEKASADAVDVQTHYRAYLRDYFGELEFDREELGLHPNSWAWWFLVELAQASQTERLPHRRLVEVKRVLSWIKTEPTLQEFISLPPHQVSLRNLRAFFITSESLAAQNTKRRYLRLLSTFRSEVIVFGATLFQGDFSRARIGFKGTIRNTSLPRPLLSDGTDESSLSTGHPLGAIPFAKFADLKEQSRRKAEADLERIRNACIADLELGATARQRLMAFASKKPGKSLRDSLGDLSPKEKRYAEVLRRAKFSPLEVLHGVAYQISEQKLYQSFAPRYQVPQKQLVYKELFAPMAPFPSHESLEMGFRASGAEVFAATLLLQTYCGWNFTSLMALPASGLKISGGILEISQGFKSKTDDDTPPFAIEETSPGVSRAVKLLLWNREMLILHRHLPETHQEIFTCGPGKKAGPMHPTPRLKDLIKRHRLPHFSLDQVRTQVLYIASLMGGVEVARRIAGHSHIGTTGKYLDQLVAQRLNSASNLEFQKRLEGELLYALEPGQGHRVLLGHTRVGDGSSCLNPAAPPLGRSDSASKCPGEHCHTNGGCPNRRIVIDIDRMEDVLRMKAHYESRHQIMRDANSEYFEKIIVPGMLFNEALHQILERGPHSGVYAKVANKLAIGHASTS